MVQNVFTKQFTLGLNNRERVPVGKGHVHVHMYFKCMCACAVINFPSFFLVSGNFSKRAGRPHRCFKNFIINFAASYLPHTDLFLTRTCTPITHRDRT